MEASLSLIVLRCQDLKKTKEFYECLGLVFIQEQHGTGPVHFSSTLKECVFELYPLTGKHLPSNNRLGFKVENIRFVIQKLEQRDFGINIPKYKPTSKKLTIKDPDKRYIEIQEEL